MASTETKPMEEAVDEKLYSRQLYVMGHEAQRRIVSSRAIVVGMSGLGVEVAKNVVLAGVSSVVLVDPEPATYYDLGGNFYLSQTTNQQPRAEQCISALSQLNPYVKVELASTISSFQDSQALLHLVTEATTVLVITIPLPHSTLVALNERCRECNVCFIYSTVHGVFGSVFCDFGTDFVVTDKDGNPPAASQIESVLAQNPAVVKVLEDQGRRHGLETGDVVEFSRVQGGGGGISLTGPYKVNVTGPFTFELPDVDASNATTPVTQGYITQVKQPVSIKFKSYKESTDSMPEDMLLSDFAKMDHPQLLWAATKALGQYWEEAGGQYPETLDQAKIVLEQTKTILGSSAVSNETLVLQLAMGARAILSPMCAALGGIVGQEVLKACSGKFTPIQGFFFLDAVECLPNDVLSADEVAPQQSRYDSQILVFGKSLQAKLLELRYFLVGAGAIGCEMLKNWALMGVGCGDSGKVHVTDMDRIEKSNLSRQFLFRNSDIGQFKSTVACRAAQGMNSNLKVVAHQEKVASDTEHVFGDDFYDTLDGVCTALDNVEARLYVDQRCLFYGLPMLESGTLGTKGNTQVVVPHVTENYGATRDPPEKSIPVCTLKNFPNQIQHTLQWARDYFEGEFKQNAEDVNAYLSTNPQEYSSTLEPNSRIETLRMIRRTLVEERPVTFDDCIGWARNKFEELFHNQIRQLLHNFPPDQLTSSGTKFWSGSKRCPTALGFDLDHVCQDAEMRNHLTFVVAASNLRAQMYGIKGRTDVEYFADVLKNVIVPDFSPADGVKIASNDAEEEQQNNNNSSAAAAEREEVEEEDLWNSLPKPGELAGFQLTPIEFDKDVDEHMDFVTACSNCRALNYSIPTEDMHTSRRIAGKIIAAIATTTALVTGLICLELYKIVGSSRPKDKVVPPLDNFKNAFCNLAIPFYTLSEPQPPAKTKIMLKGKEWEFSAWDTLDLTSEGDLTLGQLLQLFEERYNLEITMISHGVAMLFSFFSKPDTIAQRKKMPISQVIEQVTKKSFPPNQLFLTLEVIANDVDHVDDDVELPPVKIQFRK